MVDTAPVKVGCFKTRSSFSGDAEVDRRRRQRPREGDRGRPGPPPEVEPQRAKELLVVEARSGNLECPSVFRLLLQAYDAEDCGGGLVALVVSTVPW